MPGRKTYISGNASQSREDEHFTRRFATRLREEYVAVGAAIKGIGDPGTCARYASVLLYRLIFLYFLQHRGLLAGDSRYLQHQLALACERQQDGESFYRDFLRPLFSGTRSEQSPVPLAALFLEHPAERDYPTLALPDRIFERTFAFFDEYRWQAGKSTISDKDILAYEALGTLFEQEMIHKDMGAYYTPSDVTDYIARNTLFPALFTRTSRRFAEPDGAEEIIWQQFAQQPERYIFPAVRLGSELALPPEVSAGLQDVSQRQFWQEFALQDYALLGETWREVIARRGHMEELLASLPYVDASNKLRRLVTWNLDQQQLALDILRNAQQPAFLEAYYQSLRHLTILDPTCGSGAFLFAALPLLRALHIACLICMHDLLSTTRLTPIYRQAFETHLVEAGKPAEWQQSILTWISEHNLYGVDLMEEAVEICRLRLFLKVLATLPEQGEFRFPPDFGRHIRVGNSLVGLLHADCDQKTEKPLPGDRICQQAFHWSSAFPEVMAGGGFDVVIGNPPYVEYKQAKQLYTVDGYTTLDTGNLYALTMERSSDLLAPGGRFGMIVPASATCTDGYRSLQTQLLAQQELHIASFSDQRGRLFALPHSRLCIILYEKSASTPTVPGRVFATPYLKPESEARASLFERVRYTEVTNQIRPGIIPRYGSTLEKTIQSKLAIQTHRLEDYLCSTGKHKIYYTRKLSWFVQVTPFVPLILDAQGNRRDPTELKLLRFDSSLYAHIAFVALNSNLFYWLLTSGSDCRNLNMREVRSLPLDIESMFPELQQELCKLSQALEKSLQTNSALRPLRVKGRGRLTIQCMYPARSKLLIDEIDRALAGHYGFTDEELDFLVSYDGKYRQTR